MRNKSSGSLSSKIVLSVTLISFFILLLIFTIFEKINKKAFYNIEIEKANIIARTIEPLIALNIYLDMRSRVDEIALQLIENPNILALKVLKNYEIINDIKSKEYEDGINNSFVVEKNIFQPNSQKKIGTLILTYSSKDYKELTNKYTKLTISLLVFLGILFLLLGLYIKRLLLPLRKIAILLKNYSPNKEIDIPFAEANSEIGLISTALNSMQENILQYSKNQQDMNHYLEERVAEKTVELSKQLYTNSLTGLPNRLSLLNKINSFKDGALLVINIDDFKEINDFFGQTVGDKILIEFSHRLNKMFLQEQNIVLKHFSGDEFALFFMQKPPLEEFMQIAHKLVFDVEKMIFFHENNEIAIRVTVGGVYQIEGALEKADIALKSAKKQRKSYLIYDEKLNVEGQYKNNMEWVKKLKTAIKLDKIVPYFQPIFDNKSGKIVSCECLIRLIDDDNNMVTPYQFLTIAKKSRLYYELTKIMIKKSCHYFEHLDCDFSVNLSVEDMLNSEIVDYIKQKIKKYNVTKKIIFEILESEGIENYEEVSIFINEMKALGCRIAIDDFGSGYSNFEHLLKLNIDYIKIDGSLIKNLDTDKNAQIIVETIVDFAKKLNILTIAEFVHSEAISRKVKELQVDRTQGFFLAEPQKQIIL
ncbi:MAG: EAL domain-containing protein [Sulfurimonas sp.]|jgi:diguanylate cyclase (GGDEF)-like protein